MTTHGSRGLLARAWDRARGMLLNAADRVSGSLATDAVHADPVADDARTRIAFVGCGFVADFYAALLARHPALHLVGVTDVDTTRAERLAKRLHCCAYASLDALLQDASIALVINLTNPASHYEVSRRCLEAGRHVYSEKPLAMRFDEAEQLVALAEAKGLMLSGAPCNVLGESVQALQRALDAGAVGKVRLVYAELDDGVIHRMAPDEWASAAGTPWPWRDEFTVGCTLEHAGYHLMPLVALFGPVRSVTAFARTLAPDKHPDLAGDLVAPDFSVACLEFRTGVVARLTCSIVAPHDHALRVIGDRGVLELDECWHNGAPLRLRRANSLHDRADTYTWLGRHGWARALFGLDGRAMVEGPRTDWRRRMRRHEMDYLLGVADLARALREGSAPRVSARLLLHVNEIALAIDAARSGGTTTTLRSVVQERDAVPVRG
jgi:predicted dehydrogenase